MDWLRSLIVTNDRHKRRRDVDSAGPGGIRSGIRVGDSSAVMSARVGDSNAVMSARVGNNSAVVSVRTPRRRGADEKMIAVGSERIGLKRLSDPRVL